MLKRQLEKIWDQLRVKKSQLSCYLDDVRIQNLRGIRDIKVAFPYPVTVLAGPNACGKSTVLFATACLYNSQTDNKGIRRYPSDLFPSFHSSQQGLPNDALMETILEYSYLQQGDRQQMRWRRGSKGKWNKSFFGRQKVSQPHRMVYIRTLASLTNPAEVRSILQLGRQHVEPQALSAALLAFAHRILPRRYSNLIALGITRKDLLFAELENHTKYSEFHMASGERAILRLSRDISELRDALVLIDEVEAGLHPFTQQQLMLELQRLALRQNLQIIVATHSPIILDSVPPEGRIFLERTEDNVVLRETFRDVLQRAMYGRPLERLNVLCEDRVGKAIVQGVMDVLGPELNLSSGDLDIGHNTGKDEFAQHVRTLARFHQLDSFVFVLDGDAHDVESDVKTAGRDAGQSVRLFFLPGTDSPEQWLWKSLSKQSEQYAEKLGTSSDVLRHEMEQLERVFEATTDKVSEVSKNRLYVLLEGLGREIEDVCRIVARDEASNPRGSLIEFKTNLNDAIRDWRTG
jgi:predicted ATPase